MIPASYTFEKIDEVYRQKVDNGCPWHVLKCTLGKNEIAELIARLYPKRVISG